MSRLFQSYREWEQAVLDDEAPQQLPLNLAERFLVTAVMDDNHRRVGDILDHSRWGSSHEMDQSASNPARLALSLGRERCLAVFLERLDCAAWSFEHRQTLLHQAVEENSLWAIDTLIDAGAALNAPNLSRLTPVSLAGYLGRSKALCQMLERSKRDGLPFENTEKYQWELLYPASALTEALVAYAQSVVSLAGERDKAFLKASCEMLKKNGSCPNQPLGALAMITRVFSSNFSARPAEMQAMMDFAIGLGADWKALGADGRNALEEALAQRSLPMVRALESAGARLDELSLPAGYLFWKSVLENPRDAVADSPFPKPDPVLKPGQPPQPKGSQLANSVSELCSRSEFHPPFALDSAQTALYLQELAQQPERVTRLDRERLELALSAHGPLAARKPAPRV